MLKDPQRYPDNWYRARAISLGCPIYLLEDAVQEMKIGVLRGQPIKYACIDFLRKERKGSRRNRYVPPLSLDQIIHPKYSHEDSTLSLLVVGDAIVGLKPLERDVTMKYFYGYRDREIAKVVRRSDRRIGQIRFEALHKVREALRYG